MRCSRSTVENTVINLTIALRAEAAPLIQHWNLKKSATHHPFPLYEGDQARLVVSGKGKCNSAAATSWLASTTNNSRSIPSVWINLGIAGHKTLQLGTAVAASKLVEDTTGYCWYPALIKNKIQQVSTVCTVDQPCLDYPDTHTFDMEATGFYQTAIRFSTAELTHCIKVISDNNQNSTDNISAGLIGELISSNLQLITEQCQNLQTLSDRIDWVDTADAEEHFYKQVKFSVTQKHQLRRLLVRHLAVFGHLNFDNSVPRDTSSGRATDLLRTLESSIIRPQS